MRQLTRRTMLAGAGATALAPMSALRSFAAPAPCLRSLKDFRAEARTQELNGQQRELLVKQAIEVLQGIYVHLPLKRSLYGIDPLNELRTLLPQAQQFNSDPPFHAKMMDIFISLRDMHTRYRPPAPYTTGHAFLPFKVETCVEQGQRKFIVSKVAEGFTHPTFRAGVEVLSWNGVPIWQAAENAGGEGGVPSARHALGLARLTYRALQLQPIPEEDSVLVHYRSNGNELDVEVPWQVLTQTDPCRGTCNEIQQIQEFRKFLYAPYFFCSAFGTSDRFSTPDGEFGYIRIFSFDKALFNDDDGVFVEMFKNTAGSFADTRGLIVDVRDNGGGSSRAGERIVQWVAPTPGPIEPSQLYFVATDLTLRLCQLGNSVSDLGPNGLTPWIPSIQQALKSSKTFSDAFEYTRKSDCSVAGRVPFPRPVIVVTSGLTYSSAEFFAAGFQDHGGKILGVDETTGGGGAGVRDLRQLNKYFSDAHQPLPYEDVATKANGAGFQVAFRRTKRVGLGAGKELEDTGVKRDLSYDMTRDDLLFGNRDLKVAAARLLAQMN